MSARNQVLGLYRQFMKNAYHYNNYNFKNYFIRRTKDAFKENVGLKDSEQIDQAIQKANRELKVLERQSKISQMYSTEKLVVEPLDNHHRRVAQRKA